MRRRHILALLAVVVAITPPAVAFAATARSGNLTLVAMNEDRFRNYDFLSQRVARDNVDWAVALLFYNNATINKVKDSGIGPLYDQTGSAMNGRMREGTVAGYVWDQDGGRKTTKCPGAPTQPNRARHYRIYADGDDRLYNPSWGFYVFGTTHWDIEECSLTSPATFGYSEDAENRLVSAWNNRTNWPATNDWASFFNREPLRVEGDHVWRNNGKASLFYVG